MGLRFALQSGRGRTSVPARSLLVGRHVGRGRRDHDTHVQQRAPYLGVASRTVRVELELRADVRECRSPASPCRLDRDPDVAAWSGYHNISVQIDGQTVPALLGNNHATVAPPISPDMRSMATTRSSWAPARLRCCTNTLAKLSSARSAPRTPPALHPALQAGHRWHRHTSCNRRRQQLRRPPFDGNRSPPLGQRQPSIPPRRPGPRPQSRWTGPGLRTPPWRGKGHSGPGGHDRIATLSDKVFAADPNATGDSVEVLGVQHPAEIVNYQSTGATPVILAAGLALGAIVALALTLIASVRRRRRDLALLKTLGFTARQLAATIAWQASVIAVIAVVIGLPVGIAAGRQLWTLFARKSTRSPSPRYPPPCSWSRPACSSSPTSSPRSRRISPARTPAALALRAE